MAKPENPGNKNKLEISLPQLDRMVELLESIDQKLTRSIHSQGDIVATLEDLQADVEAQTTAVSSITRLVEGLADQLDEAIANGSDPVALQALSDQIRSNTQSLVESVQANTEINPL